ncbi:MAG: hypothetical protein E7158_01935 [Firmicutes bacterium]|nr:hypothetical protein [Bacillota bacterium]
MKEIKPKTLDLNNKKFWIPFTIIVFIVACLIMWYIGKSHAASTGDGYFPVEVVDGLSFENSELNCLESLCTYKVDVYNTNENTYDLKTIEVIITDKDNNEISMLGYIGNTLEKDEGKILEVSIDKDLSNAKKVQYKINK